MWAYELWRGCGCVGEWCVDCVSLYLLPHSRKILDRYGLRRRHGRYISWGKREGEEGNRSRTLREKLGRIQEADLLTTLTVTGRLGVIDPWLLPLRQLRKKYKAGWDKEGLSADEQKLRLVEENVRQGVQTVREQEDVVSFPNAFSPLSSSLPNNQYHFPFTVSPPTPKPTTNTHISSQVAASEERGLTVHGLIYDVGSGRLKEVDCSEPEEEKKAREEAFAVS